MTSWYAVRVKARQERTTATRFAQINDLEVFLPTQTIRRAWSDRIRTSDEALFPGYVFVRSSLAPTTLLQIRKVRAVLNVVGWANGRAPVISESVIDALRVLVDGERELSVTERMPIGTDVEVGSGALRGIRGRIVQNGTDSNFVVEVSLLGRAVSCRIDPEHLINVSPQVQKAAA